MLHAEQSPNVSGPQRQLVLSIHIHTTNAAQVMVARFFFASLQASFSYRRKQNLFPFILELYCSTRCALLNTESPTVDIQTPAFVVI